MMPTKGFSFIVLKTRDRANGGPKWFLNENNIKISVDFKNSVHDKIVFLTFCEKILISL